MTTATVNPFAKTAALLTTSAIAMIEASKATDTAATPFARSALAAIIGGLSSVAMTESHVLAAFGSPRSPATGKPIRNLSGLRNIDGGVRVYQAWKDVAFIADNIDADEWLIHPDPEGETDDAKAGTPGARLARAAVVGFILNEGEGPKVLFGKGGLTAYVREAMAKHGEALAKLEGVDAEPETKGENDNAPVQTLAERAAAFMVALQAADDAAFIEAGDALGMVSDYIDTRWNALADATAPDHSVDKANGETEQEALETALSPAPGKKAA